MDRRRLRGEHDQTRMLGHETESMFTRYALNDVPALERAVEKLAALDSNSAESSVPSALLGQELRQMRDPRSLIERGSIVVPGARFELQVTGRPRTATTPSNRLDECLAPTPTFPKESAVAAQLP
jgi:hypothetical protein